MEIDHILDLSKSIPDKIFFIILEILEAQLHSKLSCFTHISKEREMVIHYGLNQGTTFDIKSTTKFFGMKEVV